VHFIPEERQLLFRGGAIALTPFASLEPESSSSMNAPRFHPVRKNERDPHGYTRRLLRLLKRQKNCMICNKYFRAPDLLFLGFDNKSREVCTCEACRDHIKEFITQSAIPPKAYQDPSPLDSLWRYLDLAKYISLLDQSALYFCRADKFFDDPFEGATGYSAMRHFWEQLVVEERLIDSFSQTVLPG
jgi:hypothetical protein